MMLLTIFAFTITNALIVLLLLGTFFFVWFLATRVAITVNPGTGWGEEPKHYISFELDQDRTIAPGSTLTVFGVTLVAVNHEPAAPNQVRVSLNYTTQWENIYSALVAAVLPNGEPFTQYYSLSYGFYIKITDTGGRGVPPAPSGFFGGAVLIEEMSSNN